MIRILPPSAATKYTRFRGLESDNIGADCDRFSRQGDQYSASDQDSEFLRSRTNRTVNLAYRSSRRLGRIDSGTGVARVTDDPCRRIGGEKVSKIGFGPGFRGVTAA
jgi:hypothetical protein